ncbi:MAG: HAD-IA family hydrolase [Hyphomicrobiaceae bacterium]
MINFAQYQAISFDCYGTLIDWEAGMLTWLRRWIDDRDLTVAPDAVLACFARREREVQAETPAMRYPDVLAEVLRRASRELGISVSTEDARAFGASVGDWPAFQDSTSALRQLRERFKLVILSNVDRASFARSNERLAVKFDAVITAEDVGSYKPDPRNFDTLLATLDGMGIPKHRLLHVGESLFHDVAPANRDGIDCVWIDRAAGREGVRASGTAVTSAVPLATYPSMAAFAKAALNGA